MFALWGVGCVPVKLSSVWELVVKVFVVFIFNG